MSKAWRARRAHEHRVEHEQPEDSPRLAERSSERRVIPEA